MITSTAENCIIDDLKAAIGQDFSDNYSSTLRSVLVSVEKGYCLTKEVPSRWGKAKPKDPNKLYRRPLWLIWNCIYF